MTIMLKLFTSSAAAVGLALAAGGASAATYVDPWTTSATGGISVVFGDNGLGTDGAETVPGETTTTHSYVGDTFTDTFAFELPNGSVGFSLSSIGFVINSSLTVSTFTFNGAPVDFTNTPDGSGGNGVMALDGPFPVVEGGPQLLVISGTGGAEAVFSGTATFLPAVVPEPASWALTIAGFGGLGVALRRRRRALALA